ncbi:MAG TPA: hypothetical protein PLJ35_15650 [Anaerolineae bacterium]|nr:hypothetical protein [Anaerolineae bacterium]HOR00245.1 hypothetical protein [Anaerolineae bacterium]HPL27757.1 hypothetical protein [Anaerolineae bacterium]
MPDTNTSLLRRLKRERLHVEPGALEASPPQVQRRFAHAWAPAATLLEWPAAWPLGLLGYWLGAPAGHVVLTAGPTAYLPGGLPWPGGGLPAVARVSLADLTGSGRTALDALAQMLDHLLGCLGAAEGPWLSDGAGATPGLRDVGRRLQTVAALGYGPADPHAHFAWAFAGYWLDRAALNAADPLAERLLRSTLCSDHFWGRELCAADGV